MTYSKLSETSDLLLNFLSLVRNDLFIDSIFIKNLPAKYISDISLPPSHIKVILYLEKVKSSPISQIANKLNISKSNMTPIIDRLIELNLVNRYSDNNDRRVLRVELTPKALELFEFLKSIANDAIKDKISSLSDDDLDALSDSLHTLTSILSKLKAN